MRSLRVGLAGDHDHGEPTESNDRTGVNVASDAIGDRMKRQYEDRTRVMLPRRTYTILRADGKAFHTFTRGCDKPYDEHLAWSMAEAARALCDGVQGSAFAYIQSDEISVLTTDFGTLTTDAWFDGNLQKIVSVGASIVTAAFNVEYGGQRLAHFDCRAFTIPDPIEVENYFIWRQQDATRNSIQGLAQAHFSAKQMHGVNTSGLMDMLMSRGINWNDQPEELKRGRCVIRVPEAGWRHDVQIPIFTADRSYLFSRIPQFETREALPMSTKGSL